MGKTEFRAPTIKHPAKLAIHNLIKQGRPNHYPTVVFLSPITSRTIARTSHVRVTCRTISPNTLPPSRRSGDLPLKKKKAFAIP
ncbi:hypothetical protein CDAR_384321 [Caerostris darwini]|uniref:Uncharacterized protein n=1 Tax=Caerostris darwini TaxID=1538125 RepID=A0AAV4M5Y1_9ARAC|nr:hypothetical protein CDAR_384321 [Caerostris darwini]